MKKQVLVINYHRISSVQEPAISSLENLFSVSRDSFEKQMDLLQKKNIPLVSLHDLVNNRLSAAFSVAITVDDGNDSDGDIVFPVFRHRGIPATFFWLANDQENDRRWELAREMVKNGFTIGSHGISHKDLTGMTPEQQVFEMEGSKKILEEKTGSAVHYFSLPFGLHNPETLNLAHQSGYKAVCTTDVKLNSGENPTLIHRWNVKRNTSLVEFEGMVGNKDILQRRIKIASLKKVAKRILGKKLTARLSLLFKT